MKLYSTLTNTILPTLVAIILAPQISFAGVSPSKYLEQAGKHLRAGELEEAIQDLTQAIQSNPNNVKAYFYRAGIYVKQGNLEKAIEDYNQVTEIKPDYAAAYYSNSYSNEVR
ncbi:MAG: hypothetical protein BRC33_06510 [Cyanobacteria bacterium SW_9_44_58]|nr:MAG: hypothetical protein BRC33_06510 [Cyanobacteria bacterium SW_9_44_58]